MRWRRGNAIGERQLSSCVQHHDHPTDIVHHRITAPNRSFMSTLPANLPLTEFSPEDSGSPMELARASAHPYLLGMVGPAVPREFIKFLDPSLRPEQVPAGIGGSPVNLLTHELLARGHRVVLFTLDRTLTEKVVLTGPQLKIVVGPYRPRARHRALDFFGLERSFLLAAIQDEKPDILHAQWTYEFALAAQASGLPTVITAHDAPLNGLRVRPTTYLFLRALMAYRVLSRADRVVGVAPYVMEHLQRFLLYRGPPQVIPNGMPATLFQRRNGPRLADGGVAFATISLDWSTRKNGKVAIEAFAKVRQQYPNVKLLMFGGDHGPGEAAESFAVKHGWADGIEFIGAVPHVHLLDRLASEVDVLVHPSLEESQPMALIEAMSLGIPVIAGQASGGVPWTLNDGRAGCLVDVTNPTAVAQAMADMVESPGHIAELGQRGRALAESRFHIRPVADAYEQIYGELFQGSR
jgi:glycosyltransferase involved in cell wall biosynthesis